MMRRCEAVLAPLLVAFARAVAAEAPGGGATDDVSIDPVFDCYSANSAWGLAYSGRVLDREGRIWSYGQRGRTLPAPAEADSTLDARELRAKFAAATPGAKIEVGGIAPNLALIDKAAAGKVSTTDTGVRDAGTSACHAYVAAAGGARYRDVQLGSDAGVGDRRIVNDAPEAKSLLDWLRSIGVAK